MSVEVTSNSQKVIYPLLGFRRDLPGRKPAVLRLATEKIPENVRRALHTTGPKRSQPLFNGDSPESLKTAADFCIQQGNKLWPDCTTGDWPSWSLDQDKIVSLVAQFISLQEFYIYQKLHKRDRSIKSPKKPLARNKIRYNTNDIPSISV